MKKFKQHVRQNIRKLMQNLVKIERRRAIWEPKKHTPSFKSKTNYLIAKYRY